MLQSVMPTAYDYFVETMVALDYIGRGYTHTRACDAAGISIPAFKKYIATSQELQDLLHDAEQRSYDAMADALLNIDSNPLYGSSEAAMASVISRNIQWVLSKRDKRRFGDKVEHTHNITADRAIIDALNAGKARASLAAPVIEGVFHEITTSQNLLPASAAPDLLVLPQPFDPPS